MPVKQYTNYIRAELGKLSMLDESDILEHLDSIFCNLPRRTRKCYDGLNVLWYRYMENIDDICLKKRIKRCKEMLFERIEDIKKNPQYY